MHPRIIIHIHTYHTWTNAKIIIKLGETIFLHFLKWPMIPIILINWRTTALSEFLNSEIDLPS